MKKILSVMLAVIGIIFYSQFTIPNFSYANSARIYDGDIGDIISNFKSDCSKHNITNIYGLEYYTYQGARRCELNFGNSKNNIIRFRLNDDNSVERVLISIPN